MDRLFFLHLPKTGGSSLTSALAKKFASWEIFPWRHSRLDLFNEKDLLPFRFFHGHFAISDLDYVPKPVRSVTLLREPRSRIVSLYNYWQSFRTDVLSKHEPHHAWVAKSVGLRGFLMLANPYLRVTIDNAIVQAYLPYPLRGRHDALTASPETIIDDALATLDRLSVFGVLERFDDSIKAIGGELGSPLALPATKVRSFDSLHMSDRHEPIERQLPTPEVEALLDELTELDRPFYERAVKLFEQKFARHFHNGSRTAHLLLGQTAAYAWGDWINFGADYHLDGVALDGWGAQEDWGLWSITAEPSLRIGPLPRPDGAVRLTLAVRAAVFETHPDQRVAVMIDGREIESWDFHFDAKPEAAPKLLNLPPSAVGDDGYLNFGFRVEAPISLRAAGLSNDPRELGIGLENIHLECVAS
jgi:hypothetical protein